VNQDRHIRHGLVLLCTVICFALFPITTRDEVEYSSAHMKCVMSSRKSGLDLARSIMKCRNFIDNKKSQSEIK